MMVEVQVDGLSNFLTTKLAVVAPPSTSAGTNVKVPL
jgi:hypothetical protein